MPNHFATAPTFFRLAGKPPGVPAFAETVEYGACAPIPPYGPYAPSSGKAVGWISAAGA